MTNNLFVAFLHKINLFGLVVYYFVDIKMKVLLQTSRFAVITNICKLNFVGKEKKFDTLSFDWDTEPLIWAKILLTKIFEGDAQFFFLSLSHPGDRKFGKSIFGKGGRTCTCKVSQLYESNTEAWLTIKTGFPVRETAYTLSRLIRML